MYLYFGLVRKSDNRSAIAPRGIFIIVMDVFILVSYDSSTNTILTIEIQ